MEALLKRVDGLEKRLKDEKKSTSPSNEVGSTTDKANDEESKPKRPQLETEIIASETAVYSPSPIR